MFLDGIEAAADQTVEHIGEEISFLQHRILFARIGFRIEGLGHEADASLVQSQTEEMGAQLFGRVVMQKIGGHRRLYGAGAGGLLV